MTNTKHGRARFRFTDNGKHYLLVTRLDGTHLVYVNVSRKGTRWSAGAVPIEDTDRLINLGLFAAASL